MRNPDKLSTPMRGLTFVLLVLAYASASAQQASFQGLGIPSGYTLSVAEDVSADGAVVVGRADEPSYTRTEAFRWTASGGMVGLGDFTGGLFQSTAYGVSADGSVVVGDRTYSNGNLRAFRWTADAGMVALRDLSGGGTNGSASSVSADGAVVVGRSSVRNREFEAFRWTASENTVGLGDLPGDYYSSYAEGVSADGTVVVGLSVGWSDAEAFRWTASEGMVGLGDLPGGYNRSWAKGVSADGAVVVGYSTDEDQGNIEAFRWTASEGMVGLGDLPGGLLRSYAYSVSADGAVVVGLGSGENGESVALRWTGKDGMQSVQNLLSVAGVDLTGWHLSRAASVTDDGTVIVGSGTNPDGQTEAWRAVLPQMTVGAAPPAGTASNPTLHASPNPLRSRATLRFTVPDAGTVRLSLHDVLGREVAVVAEGWRAAGPHEATLRAAALPAGVYVVRLTAGTQTATRRITVVR